MSELLNIPPLRQSLFQTFACPTSYKIQVIEGKQSPGGLQSVRGQEVHHVWALYSKHCAARKVPADWAKFDELAIGVLAEAAPILNGIRDTYAVDWEHFYDAEILLRWVEDGILEAEGTLDGLYFLTAAKAKIEDAKSHPRPFDADTFQGKLYSFMVFMNFPEVEEVTFELIFVRYTNCRRSVTYTREDLPMLRQQIINARARQVRIHERYDAGEVLEAYPGAHCFSGDTRIITDRGIFSLRELCGKQVRVLDRMGMWAPAIIAPFGVQQLLKVTFDGGETVLATPEHRWWKLRKDHRTEGYLQTNERVTTLELKRVPLVTHARQPLLDEEGIRHGFVYGDGYKRAHRNSCIVQIIPPKDTHMLRYFPTARKQKDGRIKKGGFPGHWKTLEGINSPAYARGFIAGLLAADGYVCQNGGVHLYCEGRRRAEQLAEVAWLGGCVVSSVSLHSSKTTKFSPKHATSRELMRLDIKPATAPIISPKAALSLKKRNQMRRLYREVVSIEPVGESEVFCAVVPGSESFTLANGIITSNCQYCPLIKGFDCPIAEFNEHAGHTLEERGRFVVWAQNVLAVNKQVLKDAVDARGNEPVKIQDGNGREIHFKFNGRESQQFPLLETMPYLLEHRDTYPEDVAWIGNLLISSTKLKSYLKTKKRVITHQAIMDNAAAPVTKTKFEAVLPAETDEEETAIAEWEE